MNIKLNDTSVKHVAKMVHEYLKAKDCYYDKTPEELEKILPCLDEWSDHKYDPFNDGLEEYLFNTKAYDSIADCAEAYNIPVEIFEASAIGGAFDVYTFDGYVLVHSNTL